MEDSSKVNRANREDTEARGETLFYPGRAAIISRRIHQRSAGRLGRVGFACLAAKERSVRYHARADDLFQLRVGVWVARLHR